MSAAQTGDARRPVLLAATLASFVIPFAGSAVNLAAPAIGREFGLGAVALNWVLTSYVLCSAACLLPIGRAADLFGRKRVFLAGVAVFAAFSLLSAGAWSGAALIASRAFQGVGGAMIFGTAMAILTSVFPAEERGRALGLNVAAVYTGLSAGPVIGGFLTQQFGWRSVFLVIFALSVVAFAVLSRLDGEWRSEGASFDSIGAGLYSAGMAGALYGIASLSSGSAGWIGLAAGLAFIGVFLRRQARSSAPLLDLSLFRNVAFLFSNLAALIHYSATFATGYLLSLYLQEIRGIDAQNAGFILLTQPVLMALLSPMAGRLSDRIEPRLLASAGMALTFAGLFLFAFIKQDSPLATIIGNLAFLGIGFALFSSPNTNAVMTATPRTHYGVGAAMIGTMRLLGQASSMAVVSLLFAVFVHNETLASAPAPLLIKSMRVSFTVFAALCAAGIACSLARGSVRPQGQGAGEPRSPD